MLDQDQLNSIMADSRDKIIETIKDRVSEQLAYAVNDAIRGELSVIVKAYVEEEIKPALIKELADKRVEMLTSMTSGMVQVGAMVSEALTKQAAKNIEQSWNVSKLVDAMFR